MTKQRIAININEVMADSIARFQKWYGRDFQLELTLEALRGKNPRDVVAPSTRPPCTPTPMPKASFATCPLSKAVKK